MQNVKKVLNSPNLRVYVRNCGDFDTEFIRLCKHQFDMDQVGARKHWELLQRCPAGYIYKCHALRNSQEYREYDFGYQYLFDGDHCYNHRGELLKNFVNVFVTAPEEPIVPPSYSALENVPEGKVLQVCWGSLATHLERGSAKRVLGKNWFIYGESNPHANGRRCATPTAWIEKR